jgi:hypothetical protein
MQAASAFRRPQPARRQGAAAPDVPLLFYEEKKGIWRGGSTLALDAATNVFGEGQAFLGAEPTCCSRTRRAFASSTIRPPTTWSTIPLPGGAAPKLKHMTSPIRPHVISPCPASRRRGRPCPQPGPAALARRVRRQYRPRPGRRGFGLRLRPACATR